MEYICPYIHQIEKDKILPEHKIVEEFTNTSKVKGVIINLESRLIEAAGQKFEGYVCDKVSKYTTTNGYHCPSSDFLNCVHFDSSKTYYNMLNFLNKFLNLSKK